MTDAQVPAPTPMAGQPRGIRVGVAAAALGLYLLWDWGLQAVAMPGTRIIPWYPSAGLGLVFLVLTGWGGVPVLAIARVALALFASPLGAAGWRTAPGALGIVVAYAIGAEVIRRRVAMDGRAWGIEDAAWLSGAVFGAAALAGLASAVESTLAFGRPWEEFAAFAIAFATGDAAGGLVVAPVTLLVIVSWVQQLITSRAARHAAMPGAAMRQERATRDGGGAESAAVPGTLLEVALLLAVIGIVWRAGLAQVPVCGYLCFVPLTVIALRHGVRGAAVAVAVFGAVFVAMTLTGDAAPASVRPAQFLILALGTSGLFLGAARTAGLETEARYWHLVATAHEGIWRLDPEGRTLYASARMAEMLGVDPREMLGRPAREFVAPEDLDAWLGHRADRAAGYTGTFEVRLVRGDGARLPVLVTASPTRSRTTGAMTGAVAVVADLSPILEVERQRDDAESRERQGQRLLDAAFHTSSDALILLRASDGLVLDVNASWCTVAGIARGAVVGRRIAEVDIHDDVGAAIASIERTLDLGHGPAEMAFDFKRHLPDGRIDRRQARITASRVELDGERYLLIGGRDVTEVLQAEAQRAQISRLEELGRLAGGVAHDFNNLLTIVQSYAQLVRTAAEAGDAVDAADVREIERAAARGSALTRRLLAFSRNQPVDPQPLDINVAIRAAEGLLRPVLGARVEVAYQLAEPLPPVLLDSGQFDQVLLNLVLNACDAISGAGTITIVTRREPVADDAPSGAGLDAEGGAPSEAVLLEVCDTGAGMDEETLGRIFEPFFTTKAPGQGTGLGLPVVFGIVRQAGGWVRVHSTPGRGTCFSLRFPVAGAGDAIAGAGRRSGEHRVAPAGERTAGEILLVEDDGEVRRVAARMLRRAGYAVREAASGLHALAQFEEMEREGCPPLLVLSDVMMPGMDGGELAARLERRSPSLPVLLMSGHVGKGVSPRRGANVRGPILAKPFAAADLLAAINAAIAGA